MTLRSGTHGVIVIHGIGDNQKRGELLAMVTNPLADAMLESPLRDKEGQPIYPTIEREMDVTSDPPSAALHITLPDGSKAKWVFKEAFWADAFPAPTASTVLRWLGRQLGAQLRYAWNGIVNDPANNQDFKPDRHQTSKEFDPDGQQAQGQDTDHWAASIFLSWVYRLELFAMGVILLPLSVAAPFLALIFWLLYSMPRFGPLDTFLKWLHVLDPFLSRSLGDAQCYLEHGMWSASVRGVGEQVIIDMLNDENERADDITILAYSLGCTVAYDALSEGGKVAQEVARLDAGGKRKKLTLVTIGSAINQTFHMARTSNLYAKQRFKRSLAPEITSYGARIKPSTEALRDRFFWLDIYSRFDPGPAGPLDRDVEKQAKVYPEQVKRRRVINQDNPFRDHLSYWSNKLLVMPRLARAINGGTEYPWPEAGITKEKVKRHIQGVATLVLLRLAATGAVVGAALWLVPLGTLHSLLTVALDSLPTIAPVIVVLVTVACYEALRSSKFDVVS